MMSKILSAVFSLITSVSIGQDFSWAFSNGGWIDDYAKKIITDANNNSYITGQINWYSDDFYPSSQHTDPWAAFVAKLDASGNLLWARFGEGSFEGGGMDLALDSEGNLYVTGYFSYSLTFDNIVLGAGIQPKSFLVKYSPDGQLLWAKSAGDPFAGSTLANLSANIAIDHNDNIYITGSLVPRLKMDNGTFLNDLYPDYWPDQDIFLLKYDKNGTQLWGKLAASPGTDDFVTSIKITSDNKILLAFAIGRNEFTYDNNPEQHYSFPGSVYYNFYSRSVKGSLIVRLDLNGTWLSALPVNGLITDIDVNADGSIVAVGNFYQSIKMGEWQLTSEWTDGFVAEIGATNEVLWTKKVTVENMFVALHGNDIFVAGFAKTGTLIDGLAISPTSSYNTTAIFKLNVDGYAQWLKSVPNTSVTSLNVVPGLIGITGTFNQLNLSLDNIQLTNNSGNGDADFFAAVISDQPVVRCPYVNPSLKVDKEKMCVGDFATLTPAPAGLNIKWFKDNEWVKNSSSTPMTTETSGEFYFTTIVTAPGCQSESSPTIKTRVIEIPDATINVSPAELSCNNEPVRLVTKTESLYSYRWFKDNLPLTDETSPSTIATSSGHYSVKILNEDICFAESSVTVSILPEEKNILPDTLFHCPNAPVSIAPSTKYTNWDYKWSNGASTPELTVTQDNTYELTLSFGQCESKESVVIQTYSDIWVSNVATHNADAKNDFLVVDNPSGEPVRIKIVNRWGTLVYNSNDYKNNWPSGEPDTGTYFYIIAGNSCFSEKKGWVHVVAGK